MLFFGFLLILDLLGKQNFLPSTVIVVLLDIAVLTNLVKGVAKAEELSEDKDKPVADAIALKPMASKVSVIPSAKD